jgi:hypothetical protein
LIDREPALAEGVIDIVVGKPFNLDELLEAVQQGVGKEAEEVGMSGDGRQAAGGSAKQDGSGDSSNERGGSSERRDDAPVREI